MVIFGHLESQKNLTIGDKSRSSYAESQVLIVVHYSFRVCDLRRKTLKI